MKHYWTWDPFSHICKNVVELYDFFFDSFPFEVLIVSCKPNIRVITIVTQWNGERCWQYCVYTKELMKDVIGALEEEIGDANGCWEDVERCYKNWKDD